MCIKPLKGITTCTQITQRIKPKQKQEKKRPKFQRVNTIRENSLRKQSVATLRILNKNVERQKNGRKMVKLAWKRETHPTLFEGGTAKLALEGKT